MSTQTMQQLESARSLALGDGRYYPTIIPGVLPIIGYSADQPVEIQRWGADFLAEAFGSPTWPSDVKENTAPSVLATLKAYLENVADKSVIKSAVQAAASVYPLVYRHTVSDPSDAQHWQLMAAIKSNILRRMDAAPPGIRICCVKFLQQVVLVQTPGVMDPRRPDHNDISLALVPRDHPLIPYAALEAEGHGLLDRLLDIIHGDHRLDSHRQTAETRLTQHSDGLLVTGTLNSLGMLLHRRPVAANKILNSIFNFNPLKLANSPMTPKNKVIIKSIERTTRALLINIMKRNPENPINGRIQQYLERMHRTRVEVFDESSRKRPAPSEPTDGLDQAKRQRLVAAETSPLPPPVQDLPPGPISWRQLYTLNSEGNSLNFDVQAFQDPEQLLRIVVPVLQSVDGAKLEQAINVVRSRYATLSRAAAQQSAVQAAAAPNADDEEEYEPDFEPEDAEQLINKLDGAPPIELQRQPGPATALAPYKLPDAPPLSEQEAQKYGDLTIHRAFGMLSSVDENQKSKVTKGGFNRLAASDYGRDAWVTILSRLATRANSGLEDPEGGIKDEYAVKSIKGSQKISDAVRDGLYQYIMYDWKKRIDVAISWLNEEWYNDIVLAQSVQNSPKNGTTNGHAASDLAEGNYRRCALRLIDGLLPYIENTDKILLRLLSEIPAIDAEILVRMKKMAEDPERIDLACRVLQYLYMFRPPVRTIVVDVLADMWKDNERAKPSARKLLLRWRPEVLGEEASSTPTPMVKGEDGQLAKESANGALEVKAAT
ncbi:hypothetical protein T440DRAFT_424417 [Plenodomus tracheiphilus IPT5]|uniref:Symplekin/Pta1 N-terminal domain-containing protein n=1 Tax=Plenodomus tracheiphilus IPT5 TaxID=1408161 RepID=A0A6A7B7R4_9PLEO|nr:hypothetical protein T440DRAFT_424417 [Plenodomus tracheiphilus IPT5]